MKEQILGIWYFFLMTAIWIIFESWAISSVWSILVVMIIGEIKFWWILGTSFWFISVLVNIRYFFLMTAIWIIFGSWAISSVWSILVVMSIGEIKFWWILGTSFWCISVLVNIRYFFLMTAIWIIFESWAISSVWSIWVVMSIAEIKFWWVHFFSVWCVPQKVIFWVQFLLLAESNFSSFLMLSKQFLLKTWT